MSEKFCLKWNDFQSNASNSFGILRNEDHLQDVTLVTDDFQQISAHRVVLSVSSEYFATLLKVNKSSNLMLCLEGVTKQDITNCLDYMYNGEVQLFQENLDRFLNVAQRFKIKGLLNDGDVDNEKQEQFEDQETNNAVQLEQYEETKHVDTTPKPRKRIPKTNNVIALNGNGSVGSLDDMKIETEKYIENIEDDHVKCTVCGKQSTEERKWIRIANMRRHVETHMEGLSYSCPVCNRSFRSKNSLSSHKSQTHKN